MNINCLCPFQPTHQCKKSFKHTLQQSFKIKTKMFAPVSTPDLSAVPKPQLDVEVDPIGSSPSSPAPPSETSSSVVGPGATPMPLLPTLSQSIKNTPVTPPSPANRLLAPLQPAQNASMHRGSSATPMGSFFRTDPGAPPGCFEHSLNILGGRYLLLDQLEGSHLQRCIDVYSKQEFVCKVS